MKINMTAKAIRGRYEEVILFILCDRGSLWFATGENSLPIFKQDISKLFFFQEKLPAAAHAAAEGI